MLMMALQACAGLALLYFGGEALVRGASELALRLGVSALAIGLTVVAFGTSAPELAVSLDAALSGADDIALGNVIGSNIANIALILGLTLLIRPIAVEAKIVRIDAPLLVAASVGLVVILADGRASRAEGGVLAVCLVAYVVFTFLGSRREPEPVQDEFAAAAPSTHPSLLLSIVLLVFGLGMLILGGRQLVAAAVGFATAFGVPQAVIGLTIVAVGTSLPELATSLVAVAKGQNDIAVGNVVGSNLFNILGILGITGLVHPLAMGQIAPGDLALMLLLAVALALLMFIRRRLGRLEGALLLGTFVAYTTWLFVLAR